MISPKLKVKFDYLDLIRGPDDSYKKMYERVSSDLTTPKKLL